MGCYAIVPVWRMITPTDIPFPRASVSLPTPGDALTPTTNSGTWSHVLEVRLVSFNNLAASQPRGLYIRNLVFFTACLDNDPTSCKALPSLGCESRGGWGRRRLAHPIRAFTYDGGSGECVAFDFDGCAKAAGGNIFLDLGACLKGDD